MSEFKGTKGPWSISFEVCDQTVAIDVMGNELIVCSSIPWSNDTENDLEKAMANANLIAAAPDLLEELKLTLGALREICFTCGAARPESTIRRAEAAIAKALGETK